MSPADVELTRAATDAALAAGLAAAGTCSVEPFPDVRAALESRRAAGHHAGMSFTFRNPARSTEPARLLRNARSMLVGALAYLEPAPDRPGAASARVARYAWRDHYAELRDGLDAAADVLRTAGHRAMVIADDNGLVDRAAAHRAGIGWWGRNSNLLVPGAGSWFVLGSVVTDAALVHNDEPVADGCRSCTQCVDACPTGAIVDDGVIDARRCLAWLVQAKGVFPRRHRAALGDRLYGCDDCQDVCPPGRRDRASVDAETSDRTGARSAGALDAWVPVLELLAGSDDELLDRYGRWYIPGREPRYLRRNALIVLGNIGDAADPRHRRCLSDHVADPDDLVRAHAVWAAARLGFDELVRSCADDTSALVRAEVALAPAVPPAPGARASTPVTVRR